MHKYQRVGEVNEESVYLHCSAIARGGGLVVLNLRGCRGGGAGGGGQSHGALFRFPGIEQGIERNRRSDRWK